MSESQTFQAEGESKHDVPETGISLVCFRNIKRLLWVEESE